MAAQPTDLTTLATLKSYVTQGSNDDVMLQRLLSAASKAIANYINRDIVSLSYTDILDGSGGCVVSLSNTPISAVASVTINGNSIPVGSVTTTGYYFTSSQIILNGYNFCRGKSNVVISYTAGYATVPNDIEQACIGTVQFWLGDRMRNGEVSRSMGGQTITFSQKDMPEWIKTILMQYKQVFTA